MKSLAKVCLVAVAAMALAAFTANAQTDSTTSTNTPPKPKARGHQYRGTIDSVGSDSITITTPGGESVTIKVTSKTRIKKNGEPSTLTDIMKGDQVRGTDRKNDDGDWVASTVNDGVVKKAAPPAATTPPPSDSNK